MKTYDTHNQSPGDEGREVGGRLAGFIAATFSVDQLRAGRLELVCQSVAITIPNPPHAPTLVVCTCLPAAAVLGSRPVPGLPENGALDRFLSNAAKTATSSNATRVESCIGVESLII
jgi:hypothetical protein